MSEDPKQDAVKNPRTPRELLLEHFFLPFMLGSIKELKCDSIQFLVEPELDQLIQTFKVPKNPNDGSLDFSRLTNEQYIAFRHSFVEKRMYNKTYMLNRGNKAMELILTVICMIVCNRVPKGVVPFNTANLASKIKLVQAPRGVEFTQRVQIEKVPITVDNPKGESYTTIEKNTNERAVVRILVPKRAMTLSEYNAEQAKLEEDEVDPSQASPERKSGEEESKAGGTPAPVKDDDVDAKKDSI